MKPDESIYLAHILDALSKSEKYLKGIAEETFQQDTLIQDGVIRQIEIIGEAANRLSETMQTRFAHVPWKDIVGMRNKLVHDYFGVDIDKVWLTATQDLPALKIEIEKIFTVLNG